MANSAAEIAALADRVEALNGPDRHVDALIAVATDWQLPGPMGECKARLRMPRPDEECAVGTYWLIQRSGDSLRSAPPFTESLTTAVELADERTRGSLVNNKRPTLTAEELARETVAASLRSLADNS